MITAVARRIPPEELAAFMLRQAEHDASVRWQHSPEAKYLAAVEYEQAKKENQ